MAQQLGFWPRLDWQHQALTDAKQKLAQLPALLTDASATAVQPVDSKRSPGEVAALPS